MYACQVKQSVYLHQRRRNQDLSLAGQMLAFTLVLQLDGDRRAFTVIIIIRGCVVELYVWF